MEYSIHLILGRTPADSWRRYNRGASQFFHQDIFRPNSGIRAPVRATLLIFFLIGLLHAYLVWAIVGCWTGYVLAFFMVNGLAVVATFRLRPRGWLAAPAVIGTMAFHVVAFTLLTTTLSSLCLAALVAQAMWGVM